MSFTGKQQLIAFTAVLGVLGFIGALPLIVAGFYGQSLPDALIANSDKTVAGLIGVLGTLAGLLFRRNAGEDELDAKRAENTGKLMDLTKAAADASGGAGDDPDAIQSGDAVKVSKVVKKP